jgi:hypothetical protein
MRTYYRGPDAFVSDERFIWLASAPRVFAVRDLHDVVLVRGRVIDRRPDVALVGAVAVSVFAAIGWAALGPAIGAALAAAAAVTAAAAVATRQRRAVRTWQVRASCRGVTVTVYESADLRVFNQVTRALRRAVEDSRQDPSRGGLIAA